MFAGHGLRLGRTWGSQRQSSKHYMYVAEKRGARFCTWNKSSAEIQACGMLLEVENTLYTYS